MTAAELFTLGFLIVLGVGCITAAIHSINLPHHITTRYQAARKIQAAYFNSQPATHICSFTQPCDRQIRETDRAAAADRVRGA